MPYKDKYGRAKRKKLYKQWWLEKLSDELYCERCGYNKCNAALEWHHLDPKKKKHNISYMFYTYAPHGPSAYKVHDELKKCVCLCANCHREIHNNIK